MLTPGAATTSATRMWTAAAWMAGLNTTTSASGPLSWITSPPACALSACPAASIPTWPSPPTGLSTPGAMTPTAREATAPPTGATSATLPITTRSAWPISSRIPISSTSARWWAARRRRRTAS